MHADDRTLRAYLDGELSAMAAVRLEAHLGECAPCRTRLDEERGVHGRAGEILAGAEPLPAKRPAPSLDALRGQRIPWVTPLAWAATAVIVLGAGWLTRAALRSTDSQPPADLPLPAGAADEPAPRATEPARDTAARVAAAVPAPVEPEPSEPAADTTARVTEPAPGPTAALRTDSLEPRRPATDSVPPRTPPPVIPPPPPGPVAGQSIAMAWPPITTDSARTLLGDEIVVIPELPLRSIRGSVLGDSVVLVEQGVGPDPGVMVRLYQRRAGAAPGRTPSGSELPARYIGTLRVEILGPLPADSLSRLLEKARPIR